MKPVYLICYDYETTSAEPRTTRGVQFAAIGGVMTEDYRDFKPEVLVNEITDPEVEIGYKAAEIHGITPEMIAGKRRDHVVSAEFAQRLNELKQDYQVIMAGHNCETFDLPILRRLSGDPVEGCKHIDTFVCAIRTLPNAETHKLSSTEPGKRGLIQQLALDKGEKAHDALGDIRMVWELVSYFCAGLRMTPEQLADFCAETHILEICHLNKHRGTPWRNVPKSYVWWMTTNWDSASRDMRATIRHYFGREFQKL